MAHRGRFAGAGGDKSTALEAAPHEWGWEPECADGLALRYVPGAVSQGLEQVLLKWFNGIQDQVGFIPGGIITFDTLHFRPFEFGPARDLAFAR